jgi:4-diphosphocytidyl-2-C-methyl-D-erythritol kinase
MAPTAAEEFAPAKVNLTLHVTGRRADGYHLLDSFVAFAEVGDRVEVRAADALSLAVDGPMAGGLPAGEDNLCLRAARLAGEGGAAIRLTKVLPVASGIGGGSSDAAAVIRALAKLRGHALPPAAKTAALGADVPVCLEARARRMRGIGEALADVPPLPPAWLVLANPGVRVATAEVFRALAGRTGAPMPEIMPWFADAAALAGFLRAQRNDLEGPARQVAPVIGEVLAALAAEPGCLIARMSGSGATCFGLFGSAAEAGAAAADLRRARTGWWVVAARMLS